MTAGRADDDTVILRWARVDPAAARDLFERYGNWLEPAEEERYHGISRQEPRTRFLAARLLARRTLSGIAEVHPSEWLFEAGPHGRPEIAGPAGLPPYRFSISHAASLCACAVTLRHDVGVDVEETTRRVSFEAIARRCFSESERTALASCPPAGRPAVFFEHWTLKEALAKAVGRGLTLPFSGLSFRTGDEPSVVFEGDWRDDPSAWRFFVVRPDPVHVCAVAVRCGQDANPRLDVDGPGTT